MSLIPVKGCLQRPTQMQPYHDDIGEMGEVMGFLVRPQCPPEHLVRRSPPHFIGGYALDAVNGGMNRKIKRAQPPQGRREYNRNDSGADGVYAGMAEQSPIAFPARLALGERHPVRLQQEVANEMFQPEQRIDKDE